MANILDRITIGNIEVIVTDVNPSSGEGIDAPIGSFGTAMDGSGSFYKTGSNVTDWYRFTQSNDSLLSNVVEVNKNPNQGQFATIESALASIIDANESNQYIIHVAPGVYAENQLETLPYVSIIGSGIQSTIITPLADHHIIHVTDIFTEVSFMSLQNAPQGYAAIFCDDSGDFFQAHKVNFTDCHTNVKVVSNTKDTYVYLEYIDYVGNTTNGNEIVANNGFRAQINAENFYTYPSSSGFTACYITGEKSLLEMISIGLFGTESSGLPLVSNNYGIVAENGAKINISGGVLSGFGTAIDNKNVGTGCDIIMSGINIDNCNTDIVISHPNTVGSFSGSANPAKLTINELSQFSSNFSHNDADGSEGFYVTGNIYNGKNVNELTEISTLIKNQDIGVLFGGDLSFVSGFKVGISSGVGYCLNSGDHLKK